MRRVLGLSLFMGLAIVMPSAGVQETRRLVLKVLVPEEDALVYVNEMKIKGSGNGAPHRGRAPARRQGLPRHQGHLGAEQLHHLHPQAQGARSAPRAKSSWTLPRPTTAKRSRSAGCRRRTMWWTRCASWARSRKTTPSSTWAAATAGS